MTSPMALRRALAVAASGLLLAAGCHDDARSPADRVAGATSRWSSTQPSAAAREAAALTDIIQLTSGSDFERAGEAYFSHDMKWVIFQAAPKGQQNYHMYVARLDWNGGPHLTDITRISPDGSRNTCGWFSNDGTTLIFASTAGKDDPDEGRAGYQRAGSRYRWAFSKGMEIYRVKDWQKLLLLPAPIAATGETAALSALLRTQDIGSEVFTNAQRAQPSSQPSDSVASAVKPAAPAFTNSTSLSYSYANPFPPTSAPSFSPRVVNLALPENRLTDNDAYDAECVLSPDGKWMVYCSDRPDPLAKAITSKIGVPDAPRPKQLWAQAISEFPQKVIREERLTATTGYNGGPFFSPNGKQLIYRSDRANNDLLQVYVSDFVVRDGKPRLENERALTADGNVNWGPYPHPDGKHVLYATSKVSHGNYEIFMKQLDGSHETRITFDPGPDVLPVISPDGKYMMWASRRGADNTTQVYIARFRLPSGS